MEAVITDPATAYGAVVKIKSRLRVRPLVRFVVLPHPEKSADTALGRRIEALRAELIFFTP